MSNVLLFGGFSRFANVESWEGSAKDYNAQIQCVHWTVLFLFDTHEILYTGKYDCPMSNVSIVQCIVGWLDSLEYVRAKFN